ncbi:MAG: glycosyltransferase family 39 protein [Nitrososphaerota archaeon]|nr:glycosyltransferase family 39 protein [Nitrososphaerota archaeon]
MRRLTIYVIALTVISFLLRVYRLDVPEKQIGDEVYYVPAARGILGWNEEGVRQDRILAHPPLGKMLIALGMLLFGDNSFGWRIIPALAGTATVPLFFLVVRRLLSGRKEAVYSSVIATFMFAFENLTFYFARVARLDIFMLVFLLAGIYFLLDERPRWKILSAPFFAASFLAKEAALVVIVPLILYMGLKTAPSGKTAPRRRKKARRIEYDWKMVFMLFVATGGLIAAFWYPLEWVILVPRAFNIIERVQLMAMRLNITNPAAVGRSEIWQWFFNYPVTKATGVVLGSGLNPASVTVGPLFDSRVEYAYFIQVSWTIVLLMIPVTIYALVNSVRDGVFRFLAIYWFGGLVGWIVVNSIYRGLIYLFYVLPLLPPVIIAISQYLGAKIQEESGTRSVKWTGITGLYLFLHLINFAALYPVPIL